jgi:hypothetical protein
MSVMTKSFRQNPHHIRRIETRPSPEEPAERITINSPSRRYASADGSNSPRSQREIAIVDVSNFSASSDWLSFSLRRTDLMVLAHSEKTVLVLLRMAIPEGALSVS